MRDLQSILEDIRSRKSSETGDILSSLFFELDGAVLEVDGWPDDFYQGIVDLQQDQDFLRRDDSWTVLHFLKNNWGQLSPKQQEGLLGVLHRGFDKYHNWMGAFVTSELLGEGYADERSLAALVDLGKSALLPARAAVPHGLEVLAKTTTDESLRSRAIEQLRELQRSDSEQVQEEALISLKKLGH